MDNNSIITPLYLSDVVKCLSPERLRPYLLFIPSNNEADALIPYDCVQLLSSLLFLPLQYFEVTLRNRIYDVLTRHYRWRSKKITLPGKPEDWIKWMPTNKKTQKAVQDACKTANADIQNRPVREGDIISRLPFGVWVRMLEEHPNKRDICHFWVFTQNKIFPNAKKESPQSIRSELRRIKDLRNRLFHYEPIWSYAQIPDFAQGIVEIRRRYGQIMRAIHWLSLDVHKFLLQNGHGKRLSDMSIEVFRLLRAMQERSGRA